MNKFAKSFLLISILFFSFQVSAEDLKAQIKQILKENPDILMEVINENPVEFMTAVSQAAEKAKREMEARQAAEEERKLQQAFANPMKPLIRKDELIRGNPNGPIVIVEYADFECPYCARGHETVKTLMNKYKGKVKFIYKHLPLSFHPKGLEAAKYYEAIRLNEKPEKVFKFHDAIFESPARLQQGTRFLDEIAAKAGIDIKRLKETLQSKASVIAARIKQDSEEAAKFDITGTPGFILNGVPIRGAYPTEYFDALIQEMVKRKLVKL